MTAELQKCLRLGWMGVQSAAHIFLIYNLMVYFLLLTWTSQGKLDAKLIYDANIKLYISEKERIQMFVCDFIYLFMILLAFRKSNKHTVK